MLFHVDKLDGTRQTISDERILELRSLPGVPPRTRYLDGHAQQIVADYLGVGYIIVTPQLNAARVLCKSNDLESDDFCLLVQCGRHMEPLATRGGQRCGLVGLAEARELLQTWGVTLIVPQHDRGVVDLTVRAGD